MQTPPIREDGLQVNENRSFQRIFWSIERGAWVVFSVWLVLALAGLTGAGGYASRALSTLRGGTVDYPRVSRWGYADEIEVRFDASAPTHRLTLGAQFFDHFEITSIQPAPAQAVAGVAGTTFEVRAAPPGRAEIILHVRATSPGFARYAVGLDGVDAESSTVILP